jgi:hypothetical protein
LPIAEFQTDKHLPSRQKDEESKGQSGYQLEDKLDNPVEHPDSDGRTIAVAEHFGHSNVWEVLPDKPRNPCNLQRVQSLCQKDYTDTQEICHWFWQKSTSRTFSCPSYCSQTRQDGIMTIRNQHL